MVRKVIALLVAVVIGWWAVLLIVPPMGTPAPEFSNEAVGPLHLDLSWDEKSWLKKHQKFRVGVIRDMPPYETYNPTLRQPEGIVAGYWKLIEQTLNMQFKTVMVESWDEGAKLLKTNKLDALSFISVERAKRFGLVASEPYIASSLGIITNNL